MTDDPVEDNRTRAYWGLCALEAFARQTGQDHMLRGTLSIADDILCEIGGDLLADLLHLARLNDIDPDELITRALRHYEAEVAEEGTTEAAEEWEREPDAYSYKAP